MASAGEARNNDQPPVKVKAPKCVQPPKPANLIQHSVQSQTPPLQMDEGFKEQIREIVREELLKIQMPLAAQLPHNLEISESDFLVASLEPSATRMVRTLLDACFPKEILQASTYSGSKINRHEQKPQLDPAKVKAIFNAVAKKHDCCKKDLIAAVQGKLGDSRRKRSFAKTSTPNTSVLSNEYLEQSNINFE